MGLIKHKSNRKRYEKLLTLFVMYFFSQWVLSKYKYYFMSFKLWSKNSIYYYVL